MIRVCLFRVRCNVEEVQKILSLFCFGTWGEYSSPIFCFFVLHRVQNCESPRFPRTSFQIIIGPIHFPWVITRKSLLEPVYLNRSSVNYSSGDNSLFLKFIKIQFSQSQVMRVWRFFQTEESEKAMREEWQQITENRM